MPKVRLETDPITKYLVGLARELHMTYGRLLHDLDTYGHGELALQIAYDEMEVTKAQARARAASDAMVRRR